jgi:CRISPR-associated protein Cmr5
MSRQRTLEHERAELAWSFVQGVKNNPDNDVKKKYAGLAHKAPADIQTNGLGQTLAFWRAKATAKEAGKESAENIAHRELLGHIKGFLNSEVSMGLNESDIVEWIAKKAKTDEYRRAASETIAFLIWLKRFAESELPS